MNVKGTTSVGRICITIVLIGVGWTTLANAPPALADWQPGDGHKMHYPQLPDPDGWDVRATYYVGVADDWQCSETGLVTDFHIWFSWQDDLADEVEFYHTAIYTDDRSDANFSRPGTQVWHRDWYPADVDFPIATHWGTGDQGWYDPALGLFEPNDHEDIWQLNFFIDPLDAFYQEKDTIYWLEISAKFPLASSALLGWKTSESDQFEDDAVWREIGPPVAWHEITDPETGLSLDMAFVITPEPATLGLLALGGLALLYRRRA